MQNHGFLLVDKPAGITSHDVVDRIRELTGERTVGHAGTLDPFATGLLIVAVGRESTKNLQDLVGLDKTYEANIMLGMSSTTLDPEGIVAPAKTPTVILRRNVIMEALASLTGELDQIPPMHSAIKIGGKKLYELARKGIEIDRPPRRVRIDEFALLSPIADDTIELPFTIRARVRCSSGTYIRALARDLGVALGTEAYLTALRRTAVAKLKVTSAVELKQLRRENWIDFAQNSVLPSSHKS